MAGKTQQPDSPATASIVSSGRVEDGRGSWGPMAITPFPISAHRTGGPDFRSPALRLPSPQGTRRGSERQAFEAQQTPLPIHSAPRGPARAPPPPVVLSLAAIPLPPPGLSDATPHQRPHHHG